MRAAYCGMPCKVLSLSRREKSFFICVTKVRTSNEGLGACYNIPNNQVLSFGTQQTNSCIGVRVADDGLEILATLQNLPSRCHTLIYPNHDMRPKAQNIIITYLKIQEWHSPSEPYETEISHTPDSVPHHITHQGNIKQTHNARNVKVRGAHTARRGSHSIFP